MCHGVKNDNLRVWGCQGVRNYNLSEILCTCEMNDHFRSFTWKVQKQPSGSVLKKRCSENMQQIYRRTQCSKFTEEHPCWSVISIKSLCNFIEIALWHWCSSVNLLHIFRTPFPKNTSWWLLLNVVCSITLFEKGTTELKWFFSCLEVCN